MSSYTFHRLDAYGRHVESFRAELDEAEKALMLQPYQNALRSSLRLLKACLDAEPDELPMRVAHAAANYRTILGEYIEADTTDA